MSTITLETILRSIIDLTEIVSKSIRHFEDKIDGVKEEVGELKGEMGEVKGVLYELDHHARITNERLTGVGDRLETVETKLDVVIFEVRDHDRRIVTLEQTARI